MCVNRPWPKIIHLPALVPKVYLPSQAPAIGPGYWPRFVFASPGQDFITITATSTINIAVTSTTTTTTTITTTTTTPTATNTTTANTTATATTTNDNSNNKKCIRGSKIRIKWPLKDI